MSRQQFTIQLPAYITVDVMADSMEEAVNHIVTNADDLARLDDNITLCDTTTLPWIINGEDVDVTDIVESI